MKNKILLGVSASLYILFFWIGDWAPEVKAGGTLLIIQVLWIGRVFPLAYSSVVLILILSFHITSYDEVLSYLGSSLVWLLFSTFILAHAFVKTGLASRVALSILNLANGSGKLLLLLSYIMMFVLTIFIPSNIGKGKLISDILDNLINKLQAIQSTTNLGKSFFIGVAYVSAISAAFVPTGASSTIYAFGMFSSVSDEMSYINWLIYFSFPMFTFVLSLWLILQIVFPTESVNREMVKDLLSSRKKELGKWQPQEIKMAFIIAGILILWLTQTWHGYSIPLIGMLGAAIVVFPYVGVLDWKEARSSVDWDMMIFFAATLMLSNILIDTGAMDSFAGWLVNAFENLHPVIVVIVLCLLIAAARVLFVNVLGFLTIVLPLALILGEKIAMFSSLEVAMSVYLVGIPGFLLITQSPVHLISYSYGYFTQRDLLRVGIVTMSAWLIIVFISIFVYWNLII
ncbi:SLC13 family permease [Lentibacillus amyloliquefaciens]|uniref:Sodium-dependent dicarboxylate transporter SdcS n=1 Tax=Lentibacillus amyloliquefaciens TaxID=1472767 RepID=A0A0U4DTZ2_9BACI|nr:SLC13 family permease [Lentibacillus amyloliquefaciens]ALX48824.1 citrate:succinate antiporter [Lentibacillus amyloliquefaciens]